MAVCGCVCVPMCACVFGCVSLRVLRTCGCLSKQKPPVGPMGPEVIGSCEAPGMGTGKGMLQ